MKRGTNKQYYTPPEQRLPPDEPLPDLSTMSPDEVRKYAQSIRVGLIEYHDFGQRYLDHRRYRNGTDITMEHGLKNVSKAIHLLHFIETAEV